MDIFIGLVIFGVIAAVVVIGGRMKDKAIDSAASAVNRKVFRGTNREGAEFATSVFFFPVEAPKHEIVQSLRTQVTSRHAPPALGLGRTFVARAEEDRVEWKHGTQIETTFRAVAVFATANLDDGSERGGIALSYPDVSEREGVIVDVSAMKALRHDVESTLRNLDAQVTCLTMGPS